MDAVIDLLERIAVALESQAESSREHLEFAKRMVEQQQLVAANMKTQTDYVVEKRDEQRAAVAGVPVLKRAFKVS